MEFSINVSNIGGNVDTLKQLLLEMQGYKQSIDGIRLGHGDEFEDIRKRLKKMGRQVETQSGEFALFEAAIEQVIALYLKTEGKLTGIDTKAFLPLASQAGGAGQPSDTYEYKGEDGTNITFHMGDPKAPEFKYDNDFPYDPNESPTPGDYLSWAKWTAITAGAHLGGEYIGRDLSDGIKAYEHYRSGKGTDLEIDYARAYEEDKNIKAGVDKYLGDTKRAVDQMIASGQKPPFTISSDMLSLGGKYYPETENWQKAIGAHQIWISADVTMDSNGQIHMNSTVHEIDRYNFNKGAADIASGAPDSENGRFETLGWAKSYNTVGEAKFDTSWDQGNIKDGGSNVQGTDPSRNDRYSPYTRDYRESRDPRDSSKYRSSRGAR